MEACGASPHWAGLLQSFGHVKRIAPQWVKPYVKRGQNDAAEAEALCEAMSRPTMRFVPVRTAEQQADLMLMGLQDRLIRHRTQLTHASRGYAAEFGVTAATGPVHIAHLLERIAADKTLPALARDLFAIQAADVEPWRIQIEAVDAKRLAWPRTNDGGRRLAKSPGVGPIGAAMLIRKTPAPEVVRSGRHWAAWLGWTPKDPSTGGKGRLGLLTRAGDEGLRRVLVGGATALLRQSRPGQGRGRGALSAWREPLLKRKPPTLVAVALANDMARLAWKRMVTGQLCSSNSTPHTPAGAA